MLLLLLLLPLAGASKDSPWNKSKTLFVWLLLPTLVLLTLAVPVDVPKGSNTDAAVG